MATSINVGQTLPMSIEFIDTNGNTVSPAPTMDGPPKWSQNDSSVDLLTQTSGGLTAATQGTKAGSDVITLDLTIGGANFSATLDLIVAAAVSNIASIRIVPGTPTP